MVDKFLNRPVLATVFSILIFMIGLLGLKSLPITQFPEIAPPMVQVTTNYLGANSDAVLKSVIAPLEEQINGVENMSYISSSAGNDGSAEIKVYFKLGTNADMASVNVQNRVSAATSKLPTAVVQYGVTTEKSFTSALMFISVYSTNTAFDETFLQNYAKINIYPELQRVNGVGRVSIFGMRDYSMRIWLQPEKLAAYSLNPTDIINSIGEQNVEAAPGKFGDNTGEQFTYTIKYKGKFVEPSQYENIVIKALSDGRILRLKDVARVELGAFDYSVTSTENNNPAMALAVYQMAGSNARQIIVDAKDVLERLAKDFPPGIQYSIPYDSNRFLDNSISQVVNTFIEAFILVFIVVFLFLQDFKSTLIPGIASLVAIVGTFFFLMLFGFTLNILTLFALVLAIGMVVDDAIVVVEAVHTKMHEGERDTKKATSAAMHEITGAIISITFVMSAVFFPVTFMEGPTGMFYKQFALTLAIAVLISALNALTLSPVLCVLFIKPPKEGGDTVLEKKERQIMKRFHNAFNVGFEAVTRKYVDSLKLLLNRKWITILALLIFGFGTFYFLKTTPTGFIPSEDQGQIFGDIEMPAGTSRERTELVMTEISTIAATIPEIENRLCITGTSLLSGSAGGNYGLIIFSLKDWNDRERDVNQVVGELYQKTAHLKEGRTLFFTPPTVSGFGVADGFEMQLQDKSGGSTERFYEVSQDFLASLRQRPEIAYVTTAFNINFPQYEFDLNVDKCKLMGVSVQDVFNTLQVYYGSAQASDFNRFTKYYRVMVQAEPSERSNLNSLSKIMVRNNKGEMVPMSTFVNFKRVYGPMTLERYNLFVSTKINGSPAPGYSSGDAIAAIEEVAKELPNGYGYEFSGMTKEEIASGGQSAYVFILCFVFVYLILAAQYESYILPLSVMLSLVIGLFGVYFFVWIAGLDNNIYVQVALIMLIGLLAKNGILIVEFAVQRRAQGLSIKQSAIEGAQARLRPILMTSFAFIFGMLPLVRASGAGANGNISIGVAAAGGMLVGTLFGLFIIPVLYAMFKKLDEMIKPKREQISDLTQE